MAEHDHPASTCDHEQLMMRLLSGQRINVKMRAYSIRSFVLTPGSLLFCLRNHTVSVRLERYRSSSEMRVDLHFSNRKAVELCHEVIAVQGFPKVHWNSTRLPHFLNTYNRSRTQFGLAPVWQRCSGWYVDNLSFGVAAPVKLARKTRIDLGFGRNG